MSIYIEKTQADALPTTTEYLSPATDSAARKFITPDAVQNNDPTDSTGNAEHLIVSAAGAKSLAISVTNLAAVARSAIADVESKLLSTTADLGPVARPADGQYTESDVGTVQRDASRLASAAYVSVAEPIIRGLLQRQVQNFVVNSRHAVFPIRSEIAQVRLINQVVPELESVLVDIDSNVGAVDGFSARLLFNLPAASLPSVRAVRIFRAEVPDPVFTRPLTTLSPAGIDRLMVFRGRKNQDDASVAQIRHDENSVPNAIQSLNRFDPFTNLRSSAGGDSSLIVPPAQAGQQPSPTLADGQVPPALEHLDLSVLQNINVLANLQKNPVAGLSGSAVSAVYGVGNNLNTGLLLGRSQQEQVKTFTSNEMVVIEQGNKLSFQEIAFLTVDRLRSRRVQGRAEYVYRDESVAYGKGYKYFIVTVDNNMIQSQRSTIATIVVEGMRVPERPRAVVPRPNQTSIALNIVVSDQLVEKFEIHRLEFDLNRATTTASLTVADIDGYSVSVKTREISSNNFLLIGECMNTMRGGGQFADLSVRPGHFYAYRVYSVDVFGNKSESPHEVEVYVPDLEQQFVRLQHPTILAEVDAATRRMRITFSCDDPRVERLQLDRRDLTIGQGSFTTPASPPRIQLGLASAVRSRRFLGEALVQFSEQQEDFHWNGVYLNTSPGEQRTFVDPATQPDHIYQYRVYGFDRYGNRTPFAVSAPVLLVRRPFINAPQGLVASLLSGSDFGITGVALSWTEANIDKAAEELIGDQVDLSATSVRTMYQVQRKKKDEDTWKSFSLMTGTSMTDLVSGISGTAPNYRPPYLDLNQMYLYRVQAVQTGGFLSNYTSPVSVFTGYNIATPQNFTLRTPATYVRPFYVMLNWDTQENSGVVDRWEIERVEVNNFAAARLNLKNPSDFSSLEYAPFRVVFSEASRFSGQVQDSFFSSPDLLNTAVIVGQHYFMDTQVDFGNSYFYRIRAIAPDNTASAWAYRGIKVTDTVFESKWIPILTDDEKQALAQSFLPMRIVRGQRVMRKSGLSMLAEFSKPDSARSEPRVDVPTPGGE